VLRPTSWMSACGVTSGRPPFVPTTASRCQASSKDSAEITSGAGRSTVAPALLFTLMHQPRRRSVLGSPAAMYQKWSSAAFIRCVAVLIGYRPFRGPKLICLGPSCPYSPKCVEDEFHAVRCSNLRPRAATKHPETSRRPDDLPEDSQHRHKSGVDSLQAVAT
jgi:hypothetical protein